MIDAGTYTFTTTEGCSLQLIVDIQPFDCSSAGLQTSYSINGATEVTGQAQVAITEGDAIDLAILPLGTAFSVTGPNGNNKPLNSDSFSVSAVVLDDQGVYIFNTSNGCSYNFDLTVTQNETLSNPSLDQITVYPNPVTDGTLYLVLDAFMSEALTASLYDVYGKLVISKEISINHGQEESFNISTLSGGVYILEISLKNTNEALLKKVIKLN